MFPSQGGDRHNQGEEYMHKKHLLILAALAVGVSAVGTASGTTLKTESVTRMGTSGPNAINPLTCRFLHHERDVVPSLGTLLQKITANGKYDIAEDARHDAKLNCLTNLINKGKPGPAGRRGRRGRRGLTGAAGIGALDGYVQVTASGTGQTVTAQCPAGDDVLGGGSPSETTGSWPSSTSAWSVGRDHLSPTTLTVIATCARSTS